jgi:hypothetical protein
VISVARAFRLHVCEFLESRGFETFATALPAAARRGIEALAREGHPLPALVIADGRDSGAAEAARAIADDPSYRGVYVSVVYEGVGRPPVGSEPCADLASVLHAVVERATIDTPDEGPVVARTGRSRRR